MKIAAAACGKEKRRRGNQAEGRGRLSLIHIYVVNTGIYIISPSVLDQIPENQPYDFSRDLFPALLKNGGRLYGCELRGYWCDIGDTNAYLRCSLDALNGIVNLPRSEEFMHEAANGIYTARGKPLPDGVIFEAPVCLHPDAVILSGAHIGPNAYIGAGAYIGESCIVTDSLVDGTQMCIRDRCMPNTGSSGRSARSDVPEEARKASSITAPPTASCVNDCSL